MTIEEMLQIYKEMVAKGWLSDDWNEMDEHDGYRFVIMMKKFASCDDESVA